MGLRKRRWRVKLPYPAERRRAAARPVSPGRLSLPVAQTFPLAEIAEAHRVSEDGHVRGKLVLLVG